MADTGEDCDGGDLQATICADLPGFSHGSLGCSDTCSFDPSECYLCGDGSADPGESCDGSDLSGQSCATVGSLSDGVLACDDLCELDTSGCHLCGDGIVEQLGYGLFTGPEDCGGFACAMTPVEVVDPY